MNAVATPTTPTPAAGVPLPIPAVADRIFGCTRLCAVEFGGADNTGASEATAAIQKAIDSLPAKFGGTVHIPAGTYLIDAVTGLKMCDNLCLSLDAGAVLKVKPNNEPRYHLLHFNGVKNVLVEGNGATIQGDRDEHVYADQPGTSKDTHEWGMAIGLYGSSHVTIRNLVLRDCTGDGISMSATKNDPCEDIALLNVSSLNNRRQGCSIGKVDTVVIQGCEFAHTNGTAPECGIDIEPESGGEAVNIFIDNCKLHDNDANGLLALQRGGTNGSDSPVKNVQVTNSQLINNKGCGGYFAQVQGIEIFNNTITGNAQSGVNFNTTCTGIHMAENTLGFNYNRGKTGKDRKDAAFFGLADKYEADILARGDAAKGDFGRNYYI